MSSPNPSHKKTERKKRHLKAYILYEPFPNQYNPNFNIDFKRKMLQISLNLNIMNWSIGLSVSTLFMLSFSPSSSPGFSAQLPSLWPISNGGICWCASCFQYVYQLMFWFSMLSLLVCLERWGLLSLLLLLSAPWLRIQPFLRRKFG